MPEGNDTQSAANIRLEEHFSRDRGNDYDRVEVLLLYWQDSDVPDCKTEANCLERLLRGRFNYHVQHWAIPSQDSQLLLDGRINGFLTALTQPRSLGIIHYGGHGDADSDVDETGVAPRKSVWASHGDAQALHGSVVAWSQIQERLALVQAKADILLILDCCFAAQNLRNSGRVLPANVEVLAACASRLITPAPGKSSFTSAVIREIQMALDENRAVIVKDLYSMLGRADRRLAQTPQYHPLQANKSIRLDVLNAKVLAQKRHRNSLATMGLQIDVDSPVNDVIMDEILDWLKLNAPREISNVQIVRIVNQAQILKRFASGKTAHREDDAMSVTMEQIPDENRREVNQAWGDFKDGVHKSARSLAVAAEEDAELEYDQTDKPAPTSESTASSSSALSRFVSNFSAMTSALQNVVTRNILTIPELYDEKVLQQEIGNAADAVVNASDGTLEVRLAGCAEDVPEPQLLRQALRDRTQVAQASKSLFAGTIPGIGQVLLEYKFVDVDDDRSSDASRARVMRLVEAMTKAQSASFRTPDCLGYLANDLHGQYGIVFQMPVAQGDKVVSLNWILRQHYKDSRVIKKPSLGERFRLILAIGRALLQWHLTGWVHQGMSSVNIIVPCEGEGQEGEGKRTRKVCYDSPYLLGFEYSRERDASSMRRNDLDGATADMYRHPDRQGQTPRNWHTKYHDIYSFGLVMVEIGLWRPLDTLRAPMWANAAVRDAVVKHVKKGLLQHEMGRAFEAAALACLSGELGVTEDDKNHTRLARMFEAKVLRELERGAHLDGD